ncbi:MAG TPA: hypothetical protein VHC95_00955 [Opitutales bacterium]|nr:hypothetical protein [Opitutales bacterium]
MASSPINNLLAVFKSDDSSLPPAVRFIPAAFLFVHSEPLPDGMQPTEIEGFASVTLEGLAPLPLEQLAWGYLADARSRHIFIFAAFQDRLTVENLSTDDSFYHVLPTFFAAAPTDGAAHWVMLWNTGHVVGVYYAAGEVIPSRVEVERLKENTVAEAFAAREALLKRLGGQARTEATPGLLSEPDAVRASGNRINFSFLQYTSPDAEPTKVPGMAPADPAAYWSADMRGTAFRAAEQKRRKATMQAARFLKFAGIAAILLVIGQSVAFGTRFVIQRKDAQIKSQSDTVSYVDSREALLKQISKFTDNQLHPFEMLGVINPYRPKGISFKKTHIFNSTPQGTTTPVPSLSASCESADPQDVTTFVTALANSRIVDVDINKLNIITSLRTTTFQLNLTFKSVPEAEPMPAPPAPPPTDETQMEPDLTNPADANGQLGPGPGQFGPGGQGQFGPGGPGGPGQQYNPNGGFNPGGPNPNQGDFPQQPNGAQDANPPPEVSSGPTVISSGGPAVYSSGAQSAQPAAPAPAPAPAAPAPAPEPAPADAQQ